MEWKQLVMAGVEGTTFMTAFSYLVSLLTRDNFREPDLLGKFYRGWFPSMNIQPAEIAGWITHYQLGIVWTLAYRQILKKLPASRIARLSFGLLSGIIAVVVWRWLFRINPSKPRINYREFYIHMLAAHIVFSLTASRELI